ncbi:LAQU0S26e00232g1_1 [Lachancea quebecensis]|uniref:Structural maintenance of chromosomes protein n=1 Tax=Lachancea quebecensis TaxID=1654605 RepID=A0A0P1KZY1_9SACH|nr:LAQU0S26e00232g1_1 [Lachancea quebecensis]
MGRLLGIELYNFKSYKGKVSIGFGESNFTSVIGPNGSGKSNLMDAISFVLGVKSVHLRSHTLADLIYRGTLQEGDTDSGYPEERDNENHPSSAYVKAFYSPSGQEADAVELTRAISLSQESTYKLNGDTVSHKKYCDFLESENILIKARNFLVFQGDVEQVASQKPHELTALFEQVSGSIQYKQEYDRLREELEKARSATSELIQSRKRAHIGLKSFKEGVNKDEEYRKHLEERNKLQQQLIVWQLFHLQAKKDSLAESLESSEKELQSLESELNSEEQKLAKKKLSHAKKQTLIAKQRTGLYDKKKNVDYLSSSLLPIRSSKESIDKRLSTAQTKIESLQRDIDRQESLVKQYKHQLRVVSKAKKSFQAEIDESAKSSSEFELNEDSLKRYEDLKEIFLSSGGSELEDKLLLEKNESQEISDEIELYSRQLDASRSKVSEELGAEKEALENEASELAKQLSGKTHQVSTAVKKLKELQSRAEYNSNREYEVSFKLKETLTKLDDMNASQRETVKERKLRENVSILRRLFPGVRGLVHELCRPKKEKYAVAVSTVLGKSFDAVIVEHFSVAQQCVSFLKKQRSGILSFIPLDTIDVSKVSMMSLDAKGCTLAIDAIDYEPELERAMQYVCSDSIICDSLAIAKDLKWRQNVRSKLVSLDGSIVHKAGLMTGGTTKSSGNRWDKEEYQGLMSLKDALLSEMSELSSANTIDSERIRSTENELSFLNADVMSLRTQLSQVKRSLNEKETEIRYQQELIQSEFEPKIESLRKAMTVHANAIAGLEGEKSRLLDSVYADLERDLGFKISQYEKHSGEMMRKQLEDLRKLQMQIAGLEKKLEFETERLQSTQERQQRVQVDVEKAKIKLEALNSDEQRITNEIESAELAINKEQARLDNLQNEINKDSAALNSLEETIQEATESLQSAKRMHEALAEDIDKNSLEKANLLKNCKMLNIKLPDGSSSLERVPLDGASDSTIEAANAVFVNFAGLSRKLKQKGEAETGDEIQRSIDELNELLTVLQPNSKAVGRYEDAKVKYEGIFKETEKCKTIEKKVNERFAKIRKLRKDAFEGAFNHVSNAIDGVYRELTRDPHSTAELAGGNASLTLEDEDEPYLAGIRYHATPPTKRFKDMEFLSGGEKTIAALALLFAINSFQPSPFFVLDEVDAALDILNVERIATYIRQRALSNLQFIVISLKNTMFEKSQALVGVFRQQRNNTSRALTLNLENYAD